MKEDYRRTAIFLSPLHHLTPLRHCTPLYRQPLLTTSCKRTAPTAARLAGAQLPDNPAALTPQLLLQATNVPPDTRTNVVVPTALITMFLVPVIVVPAFYVYFYEVYILFDLICNSMNRLFKYLLYFESFKALCPYHHRMGNICLRRLKPSIGYQECPSYIVLSGNNSFQFLSFKKIQLSSQIER